MPHSKFNPKPSDYIGQFRLGIIALLVGIIFIIIGLGLQSDVLKSILIITGVSLTISGGAIIRSALRSKARAEAAKDE